MDKETKIKGFTLIELLVVVAIIGLLASVIIASLSSAREKTKDNAIKQEFNQLERLMALNYDDYNSYCQLQTGWVSAEGTCDVMFSGTYASQARAVCNNIYSNSKYSSEPHFLYTGATTLGCTTAWTFMVQLNNGNWYCQGSSGAKGEYPDRYDKPGCYANP